MEHVNVTRLTGETTVRTTYVKAAVYHAQDMAYVMRAPIAAIVTQVGWAQAVILLAVLITRDESVMDMVSVMVLSGKQSTQMERSHGQQG